jgi:hypothetical protein
MQYEFSKYNAGVSVIRSQTTASKQLTVEQLPKSVFFLHLNEIIKGTAGAPRVLHHTVSRHVSELCV